MAWQRLLCVGFCAVVLTSAAYRAQGAETSPSAITAKPALGKKHLVKGKTARAIHPATAKVAIGNATARPVASPNRAPHRERKPGQVGYASWYGRERNGQSTASGGAFNMYELTAAHRTLPLDSRAQVTNIANGRSVTVRITDRGPARQGRIIDLSQSAADELGMRNSGVARVHVEPFVPTNLP
jgi:rare lipoprotein A